MEFQARAGYRSQITKVVKEAAEYLNSLNINTDDTAKLESAEEELAFYLKRLTTANDNLRLINAEFVSKNFEDKNAEKTAEYEDTAAGMIARLEVRLLKVQGRINPLRNSVNTQRPSISTKPHCTKLPRLEMKKFSGDHHEWIPFWDSFRTTVHENDSLTGAEKFNYLQSVLTGNAAKTIAGFTPTDACYDGAISLLQEEYGDTEKLIDKLMQQLMALPVVHNRRDATALRQLYNTVIACSRSLTALGVPSSHYYIMLKTILLKCMPSELRIAYHRIQKETSIKEEDGEQGRDGPSDNGSTLSFDGDRQVKHILRFLKQEVESVERADVGKCGIKSNTKNTYPSTAAGLFTPAGVMPCFFCKSTEHLTRECSSPRTLDEKKQMLKRDGRCFRCSGSGHTARYCKARGVICRNCKRHHATALCDNKRMIPVTNGGGKPNDKQPTSDTVMLNPTLNLSAHGICKQTNYIFLQTVRVLLSKANPSTNPKEIFVRAIIDGGSQRTYVRESIVKKLKLPSLGLINMSVIPFGEKHLPSVKEMKTVKVVVRSQFSAKCVEIVAVVVPEICFDILLAPDGCKQQLNGLCLADSNELGRHQEEGINVLIGADYFWQVVTGKYRRITNRLTAVETIFGWTIQGPYADSKNEISNNNISTLCSLAFFENMWSMESLGIRNDETEKQTFTEELQAKCIRKTTSRYEARLPWRATVGNLGNNKENAASRLHALTKRLAREPSKLQEYDNTMRELIASGCAEPVPSIDSNKKTIYYMPHCPVYRPEKSTTKLRIVFDASSHVPGKLSLNDCLWTGSNLLPDILRILLRFRVRKIGLIADIEKAFLQISLAEQERDSHRFVWYSQKTDSTTDYKTEKDYRMTRVTFGVTCSPFLLSATLKFHIDKQSLEFADTCANLRQSFYMDDLITSVDSRDQAIRFHMESVEILRRAFMNLRKWTSNDADVRTYLGQTDQGNVPVVLGIKWNTYTDELMINLNNDELQTLNLPTKRNILKVIARVFDPLGYLSPILIKLKILFQISWKRKVDWDTPLDAELSKEWYSSFMNLNKITELSLPRWLGTEKGLKPPELHIFADASLKAFGAVAFLRIQQPGVGTTVRFLCAKARVAPLKENKENDLSLPKLELTAALIASRLSRYFKKSDIPFEKMYLWTDSQIALHWIKEDAKKWKPYVFSRVKEIQELTNTSDWHHCSGKENPADLLTRGISVEKFDSSTLWTDGPSWLQKTKDEWPIEIPIEEESLNLQVSSARLDLHPVKEIVPVFQYERIGNWKKMLRITAYVLRITNKLMGREVVTTKCTHTMELQQAELYWLRYFQNSYFANEILSLQEHKPVPRSSSLLTLNPFLDDQGLLRVGSRLTQLDEPFDVISPIILPRDSYLSKLVVIDQHEALLHGGVNSVLAQLRKRFWLIGGRQLIKKTISACRICRRFRGKFASQPFAPLPRERMLASRPFETVGVDFAGPLYTKSDDTRSKVYIMIFTCAIVRAVHLELVLKLTTECCLLAIRRFIARRGLPKIIYSDNAKTFKRAANDLGHVGEILNGELFNGFLCNRGITWRFSVERAPWWGGFWERLVKSVKDILKVTIWKAQIGNEELITLLAEAERIINMRPLTYISDDPTDLTPLTPDMFLTGHSPSTNNDKGDVTIASDLRTKWKTNTRYTSFLWKRWKVEYLSLLRSVHHSKQSLSREIRTGDVVLVYDAATPRIHWKLALVETCFPGRDNKIRACEVRFADGKKLRRAIQHLYPLEIREQARPEDVKNAII